MAMSQDEIRKRHAAKKYKEAPMVECACGCGQKMKAVNKHGRKRKYINGHSNRKYDDPKQYIREYIRRNKKKFRDKRQTMRHERRVELIKYKGGECQDCGLKYDGKNGCVFDFHHVDEKRFGISAALTDYNMSTLKAEADKCELVCRCCHSMRHSEPY